MADEGLLDRLNNPRDEPEQGSTPLLNQQPSMGDAAKAREVAAHADKLRAMMNGPTPLTQQSAPQDPIDYNQLGNVMLMVLQHHEQQKVQQAPPPEPQPPEPQEEPIFVDKSVERIDTPNGPHIRAKRVLNVKPNAKEVKVVKAGDSYSPTEIAEQKLEGMGVNDKEALLPPEVIKYLLTLALFWSGLSVAAEEMNMLVAAIGSGISGVILVVQFGILLWQRGQVSSNATVLKKTAKAAETGKLPGKVE